MPLADDADKAVGQAQPTSWTARWSLPIAPPRALLVAGLTFVVVGASGWAVGHWSLLVRVVVGLVVVPGATGLVFLVAKRTHRPS